MLKRYLSGLLLAGMIAGGCTPPATPTPTSHPQGGAKAGVPHRVVSLIPSATELIFAVGAGDALVGVTVNDSYPAEVAKLPKVGDQTIDPERILSLRPDLVVLDTAFNPGAAKYRRLGLTVLELRSRRLADVPKNLRLLGERLGHPQQGQACAARFEKALAGVEKLSSKEEVFVEIWGSPLMTVGADSLPNDLLERLGLHNAYADQEGYFQVDPEDVVSRRPAIIILPSDGPTRTSAAQRLLRQAGVPVKLIVVDGDLFTNPTPRVLEGLQKISQELAGP
jgi:iron complex transport system substrate-binding protein